MQSRNSSTRMLALVFALLLAQPLVLMAQGGSAPQLPNPGTTGMNRQQQQQLGLQAMGEVYKQMPVLPDSSPETQYVQHLGKKLAGVIPADRSWPYQFHVIPAADINAFALPGGPIFVNLGTIQAADNEAPKLRSLKPSLDRDLEIICARCLERDPKARYQSARELTDAVAAVLSPSVSDLDSDLESEAIVQEAIR